MSARWHCGCRGGSQKQGRPMFWYSAGLQSSSGPQPWERAAGGSHMGKLNAACIVHGGLNGQCVPGEHWETVEAAWEQEEEIMIKTTGAADLAPKASPWRLPISLTPCVQLLISLNNPASLWNFSSEALHARAPDRSSSWRRQWRLFSRKPRNPKVPVYPEWAWIFTVPVPAFILVSSHSLSGVESLPSPGSTAWSRRLQLRRHPHEKNNDWMVNRGTQAGIYLPQI